MHPKHTIHTNFESCLKYLFKLLSDIYFWKYYGIHTNFESCFKYLFKLLSDIYF